MAVCLRCLLHHILLLIAYTFRENLHFVFIITVQFMMSVNKYVLACWSCSFVCTLHHLIIITVQTLSEDIELMKCLSDIFCRVCKIRAYFSVIHYTLYGAVCFEFIFHICLYIYISFSFEGIFDGVETKEHCEQLCSGIRTHLNWLQNHVWVAAYLKPLRGPHTDQTRRPLYR